MKRYARHRLITESALSDMLFNSVKSMIKSMPSDEMHTSIAIYSNPEEDYQETPDDVYSQIADEDAELKEYFDDWVADGEIERQKSEGWCDDYGHGTY